jgi:Fur family ferric uptake transcriptional regulator
MGEQPGGGAVNQNFEALNNGLGSAQCKLTPQRQSVLKVLDGHRGCHLSAEEIYEILWEEAAEVGLATVYRTLDLFLRLNILHKVDFDDGRSRYELALNQRHHHLICLMCGQVIEATGALLSQLEETIEQESGFLVQDNAVKFYGYCQQCRVSKEKHPDNGL